MTSVRDYYESNTDKFLLFGAEGAIHRELWAEGVTTTAEAVHYVHGLILTELGAVAPDGRARVLDLGCGVGAAARFLASHAPAHVYGVSLSPRQVTLAREWPLPEGVPGTCSFHEADFCTFTADLVREVAPVDLAFAIEAFVHAPSADRFLHEVSRLLRPGGLLVIVDDVLAGPERTSQVLDEVRRGWHMQSLLSVADIAAAAAPYGLVLAESMDLSRFQRLGRPRDRLIHALQPVLRWAQHVSPWAESLVGGDALQTAHKQGLLNYRLLRFERRPQ